MKNFAIAIMLGCFCLPAFAGNEIEDPLSGFASDSLYHEKYRPQYHFTPRHRWIGDPCGSVKHNGKYKIYSWGAVESDDLVHWSELNDHAIQGVPKGISTFTGSVVVDSENTAGFGKDAYIAAFTSFDEESKKQSQSIAFSHDGGVTYQYYDQNPVLDIWSTEFRDPTVIWHPESKRWVMAVAKALEKKVAFYSSPDLKHWEWTSDFGPMGDVEKSWECPDLFKLPIEGSDSTRWVLLVSVNWAREQYFTGEFNGTQFIPDAPYAEPLYVDDGLDFYASRTFQNLDNPTDDVYSIGWVNTWDYATTASSKWGKGIWSIPRKLTLYDTPDGLRMRQTPAVALESLRGKEYRFDKKLRPGVIPLPEIGKMDNCYELKASLSPKDDDTCGLILCEGEGRKVTLTYDSASGYLTLDRTNSTDADIPKFERISNVKVPGSHKALDLDIFVDKSTIEIFIDGGVKVMTLLTFPSETQTGISAFSLRGDTRLSLSAFPLVSIH